MAALRRISAPARAALVLALAAAATLAAPARAAVEVEFYDPQTGVHERNTTLYAPAHRALIIATETGILAQGPTGEIYGDALEAWIETAGMERPERLPDPLAAEMGGGGASLRRRALDWVDDARHIDGAGLLVVIDSKITRTHDGRYVLLRAGGVADEPFDVAEFMDRLGATRARHVLVVFTHPFAAERSDFASREVSQPRPPQENWLTEASTGRARQALVPTSTRGQNVVRLLIQALSREPGSYQDNPRFFDPDGFVTARDLANMSHQLEPFQFFPSTSSTAQANPGDFVLTTRAAPEAPFSANADDPLRDYSAIKFTEGRELRRFVERYRGSHPDSPWVQAAMRQVSLREQRRRFRAGMECASMLGGVDPVALISLNAGVIGRLGPFEGPGNLARQWLNAIAAATGLGEWEIRSISESCADAGIGVRDRRDRRLALKLATLEPDAARLAEILDAAAPGSTAHDTAAVLAALARLANPDTTAGRKARLAIASALTEAIERGVPAAMLARSVGLFDSDPPQAARLLARAAEAGVPVAQALYGALTVSEHPALARWRTGIVPDIGRGRRILQRAIGHGIRIDPAILQPTEIWGELLTACEKALVGINIHLVDAGAIRAPGDLAALFAEPIEFFNRRLSGFDAAHARAICAEVPPAEQLPEDLRAGLGRIAAKLAVLDILAGDLAEAEARLSAVAPPSGEADFLLATLLYPRDRARMQRRLTAAAGKGVAAAELAVAMVQFDAERADRFARSGRGLERLRRLAARPMPAAQALLASALVEQAAVLHESGRAGVDRALLEALHWMAEAKASGGIETAQLRPLLARLVARAPGMLGLDLAPLSAAHRRLLDRDRAAGVLVLSVDPDGPAARIGALRAGDVIAAIDGTPVNTVGAARRKLLSWIFKAARRPRSVALDVVSFETGREETRHLDPPVSFERR